jgi:hypothetical protein
VGFFSKIVMFFWREVRFFSKIVMFGCGKVRFFSKIVMFVSPPCVVSAGILGLFGGRRHEVDEDTKTGQPARLAGVLGRSRREDTKMTKTRRRGVGFSGFLHGISPSLYFTDHIPNVKMGFLFFVIVLPRLGGRRKRATNGHK